MLRRGLGCWLALLALYPNLTQRGLASLAYPKVSIRLDTEPLHASLQAIADVRPVRYHKLRSRETLASVLSAWGVPAEDVQVIAKSYHRALRTHALKAGRGIKGTFVLGGRELVTLEVPLEDEQLLVLEAIEDGTYEARVEPILLERRVTSYQLRLQAPLSEAVEAAGLPASLVPSLSELYSCLPGTAGTAEPSGPASLVAEVFYHRGSFVRAGAILAAELNLDGEPIQAYRFQGQYYDLAGQPVCGAFLQTPLDTYQLSDGFRVRRVNRVSGRVRYHKGVDLCAPYGAPVRAIGDGVVVFAGRSGAYGRMVKVQHNAVHSSLYAHLSRFTPELRSGMSVQRGDVIGFVGQTGRATGPHLHFEVFENGRNVNPMSYKRPAARAIAVEEWQAFENQVLSLGAPLLPGSTSMASLGLQP
jgi:murein DD-endopeptidase MepM/ murein hydrolase activator NlpD